MELEAMRETFDNKISSIVAQKRVDNKAFLNNQEYNDRITQIKRSKINLKTVGSKKNVKDYRLVAKYDVVTVKGKEHLIKRMNDKIKKVLHYATNDELFDILHSTHIAIGHGGRNRMHAEIKKQYANITKEAIMEYLALCNQCQKKPGHTKKGFGIRSTLQLCFNSRAQIDIIDMPVFNDFQFIMVYQDRQTKFIQLRALKTKSPKEIASNMLDICTIFGVPTVLYSDHGCEFVNSIITELHAMWSEVKIVSGRPKDGQTSTESTNMDVEDMVALSMSENQTTDWPSALKFVQFQKNRVLHSEIGKSPCEAMFGGPGKLGLASSGLSQDEIQNINTEEEIEAILQMSGDGSQSLLEEEENQESEVMEVNTTHDVNTESAVFPKIEIVEEKFEDDNFTESDVMF